MIISKNVESFYNKHKEELLKLIAKDQNKPLGFDEMEYAFVDMKGRKYYSFSEATALPIERLGKLEEYKVLMSSGLHNGVVSEITEAMEDIVSKIVNSGLDQEVKKNSSKNLANLGLLINELKERQKIFIPIELFYAFLSCQLVREDENPYVFNESIHKDKIVSLMELNEQNGGFFFGQRELNLLKNLLNMQEEEWNEYWLTSMAHHKHRRKALEIYLSGKEL
jgi:hypothetical protein